MSRLHDPHLSEGIRRYLDLEGPGGPVAATDEISPVLDLGPAPEMLYLRKERIGICWGFAAQEDLEFGYAQLLNPEGSNHLCVVDGIWGGTGADTTRVSGPLVYRADTPVGVPATIICVTDTRWGSALGGGGTATQAAFGTAAAVEGDPHFTLPLIHGDAGRNSFAWHGTYVLRPGTGIALWTAEVNLDLDANFSFRERMLRRHEL